MTPKAFELTCWRLFVRGKGKPSARQRIIDGLGVPPEKYDAWRSGAEAVPDYIARSLRKQVKSDV